MDKKIRVLNTHNGQVGEVSERIFLSPVFNKYLVEYVADKKPVPELFKSREKEDYELQHSSNKIKNKKTTDEKDVEVNGS